MTTQLQELSFGDFSGLSDAEQARVLQILHRPKGPTERKVEFPWDDVEGSGEASGLPPGMYSSNQWMGNPMYPPPQGPAPAIYYQGLHMPPGFTAPLQNIQYSVADMQFGFSQNEPQPGEGGIQQASQQEFYQYESTQATSRPSELQDASSSQGSRLQASLKPYERRNKKKRPPDYYKAVETSDEGQASNAGQQYESKLEFDSESQDVRMASGQERVSGVINMPEDTKFRSEMHFDLASQGQGHQDTDGSINYAVHNSEAAPVPHNIQFNPHQIQTVPPVYPPPTGPAPTLAPVSTKMNSEELREVVVEVVPQNQVNREYDNRTSVNIVQAGVHVVVNQYSVVQQPMFIAGSVENTHSRNVDDQVRDSYPSQSVNQGTQESSDVHTGIQNNECAVQNDVIPSQKDDSNVEPVQDEWPSDSVSGESSTQLNTENSTSSILNSVASNTVDVQTPASITVTGIVTTQASSANVVLQSQEPPKPKTWAGLFKSGAAPSSDSVKPLVSVSCSPVETGKKDNEKTEREVSPLPVPAEEDGEARRLGDLLSKITISHASVALQPRGLINRANWCYINGTLQALVACPPFYNLLKKLPKYPALSRGPSSTPILDAISQFVNEFEPMPRSTERGRNRPREIVPGAAFEPSYVYKMLQVIAVNPQFKLGKQEDAEEFLSCILDGMHEEMSSAVKLVDNNHKTDDSMEGAGEAYTNGYIQVEGEDQGEEEVAEDSWEQVGPKKKSVLTRRANFAKTPIADIFAGMIRSAVNKASAKETATLQPFFTLQLDIQSDKVWSVKDALQCLVSKESIEYTCSKTKEEVEVVKKSSLEELPPVLILHLKFFVYNKDGGSQKVMKKVEYPVELEITKDLLSPNARSKLSLQQRAYKLFAVVYHHGKTSTGGHYTTSVFHPGINGWVNSDDSIIKTVPPVQVLRYSPPRVPYLLYYRRLDSH